MTNLDLTSDDLTSLEESLGDDYEVCSRIGCFRQAAWRSWHTPGYSCPVFSCDRCKEKFDTTVSFIPNITWVCPKCRRDPLQTEEILWRRL